MTDTNKRTERKSQGVRSKHHHDQDNTKEQIQEQADHARKSSKVMDMSWAAKYLDDDWEGNFSKNGGYDTKANAHAQMGTLRSGAVDLMSQTQEFTPVNPDDEEEELKIRDAVTDKTIVSLEEVHEVRDAVSMHVAAKEEPEADETNEEDPDELKIRDAVTDKTIVRVSEADEIRNSEEIRDASFSASLDEDLEDLDNIRDARSVKTPQAPAPVRGSSMSVRAAYTGKVIFSQKDKTSAGTSDPGISATGILNDVIAASEPNDSINEPESHVQSPVKKKKSRPVHEKPVRSERKHKDVSDRKRSEVRSRQSGKAGKERPARDDYYERPRYREYYAPVKSPLRFIPLVLVIAICVLGFITARIVCHDVPVNVSDYSKISYTVNPGLTDEVLSQELMDLGLIDNPLVFRLRCVFYDAHYVEGTYELSPCYSTEKIINILSGYKYGDDE